MIEKQQKMILSSYLEIYELVVPKDNLLRRINEIIDFTFIYDELAGKYCLDNGRKAVNPIRMFKYLLLKFIFDLSDVDVVERSKYDMSFKYFLDMVPEEEVINLSSLTKFRKMRLKDINLLDILINKTVSIAIEKGIIKTKSIIVDATHTKARYNQKTPCEILREKSKLLRKSVYQIDSTMKELFPEKNAVDDLEKEIDYCNKLIDTIKTKENIAHFPKIQERLNQLEEIMLDDIEHIQSSNDKDAMVGHKTADSSFFGYKTHIAMTEERIITAATVTTGEKNDGKELKELYNKSKAPGLEIKNIIGDAAYSEKGNIELAETEGVNLVAKLNPSVTQRFRSKEKEFEFNKDAGMYVCKAGHMAIRKARQGRKMELKTKLIAITLMLKNVKVAYIRKVAIKKVLRLRHIQ